jgi:hypothetical protein
LIDPAISKAAAASAAIAFAVATCAKIAAAACSRPSFSAMLKAFCAHCWQLAKWFRASRSCCCSASHLSSDDDIRSAFPNCDPLSTLDVVAGVNPNLTVAVLQAGPGHRAYLTGFWPHSSAQRCRLLRINEQHSTRSTGIWAGGEDARNTLRI